MLTCFFSPLYVIINRPDIHQSVSIQALYISTICPKNLLLKRKKGTNMRQSDGTDLLGSNDSRSADIGIIYVAPDDSRQSVLTAILTQERLHRKEIALV